MLLLIYNYTLYIVNADVCDRGCASNDFAYILFGH
jgi:hypothetical protein